MKKTFNPIIKLSIKESSNLAKVMNGEIKSSIKPGKLKKILKTGRILRNKIENL